MTTEKDKARVSDNELIARFMGAEFLRKQDFFDPDKFNESYIFNGHPGNWRVEKEIKSYLTAPMLAYHSDWDWIMPVWIKFRDLDFVEDSEGDHSHREWVDSLEQYLVSSNDPSDFFKRLVEAIKWHNEQR